MFKYRVIAFIFAFVLSFSGCGGGGSSSGGKAIMPLGDSITYDDANAYYKNGKDIMPEGKRTAYRSFLAYNLKDAGFSFNFVGSRRAGYDVEPKFDPDNEGHPGWSSFDIAKNVYSYLNSNPADIVLLHIGTNDKYNGGGTRVDGTEKILDEIKRWGDEHNKKVKVFVALIINRWFWDRTIEKYNNNLREMILKRNDSNIVIVDMSHLLSGSQGDYLENTHPNKQGYKKMADKWFEALMDSY